MPTRPVAIVTGGAKRVGRAVVERLSDAGFAVMFTFRTSDQDSTELKASLAQRRREVIARRLDLSNADAVEAFAAEVRSTFDGVNVLVNCASMYVPDDDMTGASASLQRTLYDVNAIAPARLMALLSPELTVARGCVVNFLDLLAELPWPKYSAYCASKAALHSLTLSYARKLAPHVRVNGIAPGVIDWPADMPEADRQAYLQKVPLARAGTPREAADVVHWLATAAPYVTGQVIRLDGGRSLV